MLRFKKMNALYPGKCAGCGEAVRRWSPILWDAQERKAYHDFRTECAPKLAAPVPAPVLVEVNW